MRSAGVTTSASKAYIQPTPLEPQKTRALDGRGVLDDLELRVLALRHDELAVQLPVRHQLGDVLHDRVVGTDRVGGDHVDVGQLASHSDRLAPGDERRLVGRGMLLGAYHCFCHDGSP
jgi:hypothetical protein